MSKKNAGKKFAGLGFPDFIVVILFLFTAVFSINLFRMDLMQTINLKNAEPVGEVIIRKNIVQRRLSNRVLWDRLDSLSSVYDGDLIRVAELSEAALSTGSASIELGENTLIRIRREGKSEGLQIKMSEGNLSVTTQQGSGKITIDVKGRKIQTKEDSSVSIFNVSSEVDTMVLKVNEGTVQIIDDDNITEIKNGEKIALNTDGEVSQAYSAVVINSVLNTGRIPDAAAGAENIPALTARHADTQMTADLSVPALGRPENLQPARGRRYTTSDLQTQRSINFSWQAVNDANAYLLTIYRQSGNRRRLVFTSQPLAKTYFSLDNLSILDNGTFVWQVEAIKRKAGGSIEQRGAVSESTFIMDIVLPGRVKTEGVEIIDE